MAKSNDLAFNQIAQGNIKVYEQVFRELYAPLCGFALKLLKQKELAEEVVQEIFYTLWKNRNSIEITLSLKSYLYRSVHNKALHQISHQKVQAKYVDYAMHQSINSLNPEQGMMAGEFYQVYKLTLRKLPEKCQKIFIMSRTEGLKYKEIAEKLSISIKTVEANMGKALSAFRTSFKAYETHMPNSKELLHD